MEKKLKYEWGQSYPIQPLDNICMYKFIKLKRFRPSYDQEPRPNMSCLLNWEYYRIWKTEHDDYIQWRNGRDKIKQFKWNHKTTRKPKVKVASKPKWIP